MEINYKNILQERFQKSGESLPVYNSISFGQPHNCLWMSSVNLATGKEFVGEQCNTKKLADMSAAKMALSFIDIPIDYNPVLEQTIPTENSIINVYVYINTKNGV